MSITVTICIINDYTVYQSYNRGLSFVLILAAHVDNRGSVSRNEDCISNEHHRILS